MNDAPKNLTILTPIYNDWESYLILYKEVKAVMQEHKVYNLSFLVVDDCSLEPVPEELKAASDVKIVCLVRNLGHQRALSVGMSYIKNQKPKTTVVISMDGDGEDRPEDIPKLLEAWEQNKRDVIVFARRQKRSEGPAFRLFYLIYKAIFKSLTGQVINFGNYSLIPSSLLQRIVYVSETWNNYPAAVIKSRLPFVSVRCHRGHRYKGESKMNFISLVMHGLSAVSVYIEVVAVRLIVFFISLMLFSLLGIAVVVFLRFFTAFAIPGWATTATMGFLIMIAQAVTGSLLLTFVILSNRNAKSILPDHEYTYYIKQEN